MSARFNTDGYEVSYRPLREITRALDLLAQQKGVDGPASGDEIEIRLGARLGRFDMRRAAPGARIPHDTQGGRRMGAAAEMRMKADWQRPVREIRWALGLLGGVAITQVVLVLGQSVAFAIVDPSSSADPILAVASYGLVLQWLVFPAAAFAGGVFVGMSSPWLLGGPLTAVATALPLWAAWAQPQFPRAQMLLMCSAYAAVSFLGFLAGRRLNRPRQLPRGFERS